MTITRVRPLRETYISRRERCKDKAGGTPLLSINEKQQLQRLLAEFPPSRQRNCEFHLKWVPYQLRGEQLYVVVYITGGVI